MTPEIKAKIEALIASDLSAQVGDVLRERLEMADKYEEEVEDHHRALGNYDASQARNSKLRNELVEISKWHNDLKSRVGDLEARERRLEITVLEAKLQCANDKAAHATAVAMGLVRNTEYRKQSTHRETAQVPGHNDGNGNWVPDLFNTTDTKDTETVTAE